ncbi:hypothetical protein JCM5350_008354, partial [Sporobolomyces pararoseus]
MSQASFPVEVMNEIFRSSDLDSRTLARCCRLSRRYLESAQKWLYHHVNIRMSQRKAKESDIGGVTPKLSPSTEKLLSLLENNPRLAALVKSVKSETTFNEGYGYGNRRYEGMLDRLCKSAPFLDSLVFKCLVGDNIYHIKPEWDDRALPYPQIQEEETYRDELDRYIEVKGVDLTPHSYLFLSQLVNLRVLHIRRAVRNPIGMPFEYDLGLTKLESVRIHKITPDFDIKQFLSSSAATIRDLQVPYNFVFDLDLSDYPQLNRLELTMYGVDQYKAWTQGEPEEFWRRVEHCTNLVTLAFAYEQIGKEVAAKLFGRGGGFGAYTPPSVRRIDITDDYSLDNVADIIYNGNIMQLGITLGRYEQSVRDEVVRLMCKDQNVELIHLPNPNIY